MRGAIWTGGVAAVALMVAGGVVLAPRSRVNAQAAKKRRRSSAAREAVEPTTCNQNKVA